MSKELEDDLRRTLAFASERAPRAPGGLSGQVVARSRGRRMRVQALVAAVAVVVVAGGVGAVVRAAGDHAAPTAVTPVEATGAPSEGIGDPWGREPQTADIPDLVDKVWPEAVWRIPGRLPGGQKYQPRHFIDDRTLLLETWESFEKANAIYAYDLVTGRTRKIAAIRTPKGVYASGYVSGAGHIVYQTVHVIAGESVTRFWSVPIKGGEPTAIETDKEVKSRGTELAVVGDRVAFSLSDGGVFTVPLGGGAVTAVQGADRHHLLSWPWVGTPGDYTPGNEPSFEELLNVETGETSRAVIHPGETNVRCGVTTCVGRKSDRTAFYRLRDGSQERVLDPASSRGLAADRFVTVHLPRSPGGQTLNDLVTGKSADLGLRPNAKGQSTSIQPDIGDGRLVAYELKGKYVIIDLMKIQ
ncbi:hypothetical protein [Nonomuraea glycinis]|uniref:hypothetical protein n=1 Tax=Nonomuraea glycinis TaxID=2047744 RepID=UPI0033A35CC7